jgi:predicted RNase H-like nuclease (RuvC/YqgF family)
MVSLLAVPLARAQESPTAASLSEITENYKILQGTVQNLQEANDSMKHQITDLQSKIDALTAQQGKSSGNYATADDIQALKDAIEAVDKKRMQDNDEIVKALNQIAKLGKTGTLAAATPAHPAPVSTHPDMGTASTRPDGPGFLYEVKPDDTPSKIARKLLEEKGIKITSEQIMQANPQVKDATKLYIGQKLFIPVPKTAPDTANNN